MSHETNPHESLAASRYRELVSRCRQAGITLHDDAGVDARIKRTLLASDYAFEVWSRHPDWLAAEGIQRLRSSDDAASRQGRLALDAADEATAMQRLRQFRHAESLRIVFRDVNGMAPLAATLADTTVLYEVLTEAALRWCERRVRSRFGDLPDASGKPQRSVVFGLGKLGGGELNFSSDIDLILAYREDGVSDGRRSLDAGEYTSRLVRQFLQLLTKPTADGIVARVDLRLRPFGSAGRPALSFTAMEQYYQREGRDWERYAWIKARPIAGDIAGGRQLLATLRPFIYRRYFDYTAFAGLRDLKARINAEVARRDLADNLKLGPGGIREIEFIVQLMQLIRGGREPGLRTPSLMTALATGRARGYLPSAQAKCLLDAYEFLRLLENRVQMFRDIQTHDLPEDADARTRIALAMGHAHWQDVTTMLARHRQAVNAEFDSVLVPEGGRDAAIAKPDAALWKAIIDGELNVADLEASGFPDAASLRDALCQLPGLPPVRAMSPRGHGRFERLMPQLLAAARGTESPTMCMTRLVRLIQVIVRRSAYLALLEEQPAARQRLADVFAQSRFLAERVIAHPLLLDDILGPRMDRLPLRRADISAEIRHALETLDEHDAGTELDRLNELKGSLAFRLGLAFLDGRADPAATTRRLAALAEAVVGAVLAMATRELEARHGLLPGDGPGFAILGYGSLGSQELGFASDLDLVFVYDAARTDCTSDGRRPLSGNQWYQRLAQRIMHWLGTLTGGGRLYEVDTRLRPDGSGGSLVTSLDSFAAYQEKRAWTWEHQALLRARPVAGGPDMIRRFTTIREHVLTRPNDPATIRTNVTTMRHRWRAERDRSNATLLDLKHGAGCLLDIQFLLQGQALIHARQHPALLQTTSTMGLAAACHDAGLLNASQVDALEQAHAVLLSRALACTLDGRPRLIAMNEALTASTTAVLDVADALGYGFRADGPA